MLTRHSEEKRVCSLCQDLVEGPPQFLIPPLAPIYLNLPETLRPPVAHLLKALIGRATSTKWNFIDQEMRHEFYALQHQLHHVGKEERLASPGFVRPLPRWSRKSRKRPLLPHLSFGTQRSLTRKRTPNCFGQTRDSSFHSTDQNLSHLPRSPFTGDRRGTNPHLAFFVFSRHFPGLFHGRLRSAQVAFFGSSCHFDRQPHPV